MNREQIIRMADQCGIPEFENNESQVDNILRFAALVAAAERDKFNKERQQYADWFDEAAADIADWGGYASEHFQSKHGLEANVQDFKNRAAALRARGQA